MKIVVLKYAALVLWAMIPTMLYAQLNPKPGFVITNQNDTIYGTIDYLSDKKCAHEFYVGAGVDVAIQKHVLRLTAEYCWTHSFNNEVDVSRLGICAEFRL
jgi:hypothetical protein